MAAADEILACERAVWQALVDGDAAADDKALAEDFLGIYPDGFSGKAAHVAALRQGPTVASFSLGEVRLRALGPDHFLIAYRADYRRPGAMDDETMFVASLWRRVAGNGISGWENIFSQDTPATGIPVP